MGNGRKWFTTGAMHPHCRFMIVMGVCVDGKERGPHARHSMVLVPIDTPGVRILRNLPIVSHYAVEGHCEVLLRDVHLPADALLGGEGAGFAPAQARLLVLVLRAADRIDREGSRAARSTCRRSSCWPGCCRPTCWTAPSRCLAPWA